MCATRRQDPTTITENLHTNQFRNKHGIIDIRTAESKMMEPLSTKCDNTHVVICNNPTAINDDHQLLEAGHKQASTLKHQNLIIHTLAPSNTEFTYMGTLKVVTAV